MHSICQLWSSTYIKSWCVPIVIAARAIPKLCFNLLKPAESLQPRKRMTNTASSWHLRLWFSDVIHVAVKIIQCCLSLAVKIKSKFTQLCNPNSPTAGCRVPASPRDWNPTVAVGTNLSNKENRNVPTNAKIWMETRRWHPTHPWIVPKLVQNYTDWKDFEKCKRIPNQHFSHFSLQWLASCHLWTCGSFHFIPQKVAAYPVDLPRQFRAWHAWFLLVSCFRGLSADEIPILRGWENHRSVSVIPFCWCSELRNLPCLIFHRFAEGDHLVLFKCIVWSWDSTSVAEALGDMVSRGPVFTKYTANIPG